MSVDAVSTAVVREQPGLRGQRVFDVLLCVLFGPPALVVVAVLSLLLLLFQGRPVWFVDTRIGFGGRPIAVRKLRTMRGETPCPRPIAIKDDERITPLGGVLRRSRLDELPQILDIVAGRLAWVGARPEAITYVNHYERLAPQLLDVRPGLVGVAALAHLGESEHLAGIDPERHYVDVILPRKLRMELDYHRRRTLLSDLLLVLRTPFDVLRSILPSRTADAEATTSRRLLVISSPVRGSGLAAHHHVSRVATVLAQTGARVLVLGDPGLGSGRHQVLAWKPPRWLNRMALAQAPLALEVIRHRRRFDEVVLTVGCQGFVLVTLAARLLRRPVRLLMLGSPAALSEGAAAANREHGLLTEIRIKLLWGLEKLNVGLASSVATESPAAQESMGLARTPKVTTWCILPVDLTTFQPRIPFAARGRCLIYVGRFVPTKGFGNLLAALPELFRRDPEVRVTLVGDGPLTAAAEALASRDDTAGRLRVLGWQNHRTLSHLYSASRVAILPSYSEGVPTVVLEAMACGTPVLASPVGAIPELVRPGDTGWILDDRSPEPMSSAILDALDDPHAPLLAQAGVRRVREICAPTRLREAYRRFITGRSAA